MALGRTDGRKESELSLSALRNDDEFCHVAAWEWTGEGRPPVRHVEPLVFENVHLATRSYK